MFKWSLYLLFFLLPLLLLLRACVCSEDKCIESPSSCGPIPRITYPFRLRTDPAGCGNKQFEITCESNVPVVYFDSAKYYVRSINYNNFTIRLSDASLVPLLNSSSNSFLCNRSAAADSYLWNISSGYLYTGFMEFPQPGEDWNYMFQTLAFISCPSPIPNPTSYNYILYKDGSVCAGGSGIRTSLSNNSWNQYWYARVGESPNGVTAGDVVDSCRLELVLAISMPLTLGSSNLVSYKDVYDCWDYGFELSWFEGGCLDYFLESNKDPCYYLTNMSMEAYYARYYGGASSNFLRPLLIRLDNSALGRLLTKINWYPPLYNRITTFGYILDLLRYALLLCVLLHAAFFLIGAPLLMIHFVWKWRRRHLSFYDNIEDFLQNSYDQLMPVRYSYADIKKITKGFTEKLGQGGYGSVYKGKLRSGQLAAVKVLGKADTDGKDFINEVSTIGRVHHFNVVRLIGFCADRSKRALVYPFMPNGSLDKYILSRGKDNMNNKHVISSEKMYEIALGVARGIEYLHQGCDMQILHFDIKPHNILLDENFVPKVADFGLAKLYPTNKSIVSLTAIKGTIGYMAPEFFYRSIGGISYKADVYSFGRMLMEMATKKRNTSSPAENSSQIFLPSWVHDQFSQGNDNWLEDTNTTEEEKEVMKKMMVVGLWCVQLSPFDRPSMHKVIEMLQGGVHTLQLPPKPSFAPSFLPLNTEDTSTGFTSTSQSTSSFYTTGEFLNNEEEVLPIVSQDSIVQA